MTRQGIGGAGLGLLVALTTGGWAAGALADEGDPVAGERMFRQCGACHQLGEGQHRVGPSLHGVLGRQAGTAEGFRYSPDLVALGEVGVVWDEELLDEYLEDPVEFLKEMLGKPRVATRMPNKFPREQMRRDIIAYLVQATE
jgi:cytochrome c